MRVAVPLCLCVCYRAYVAVAIVLKSEEGRIFLCVYQVGASVDEDCLDKESECPGYSDMGWPSKSPTRLAADSFFFSATDTRGSFPAPPVDAWALAALARGCRRWLSST